MGELEQVPTNLSGTPDEGFLAFATVAQRYVDAVRAIRAFATSLRPVTDELADTGHATAAAELSDELKPLLERLTADELEPVQSALRSGVEPESPRSAQIYSWIRFRIDRLHHEHVHQHRSIVNRSALVSLISAYEVALGRLARLYFLSYPASLSGDDKVLSFNELVSFESLDEAREHLIARRVDEMLKGTREDWSKFFVTRLKLDPGECAPNVARWDELFLRRNLVIHADGHADRKYIKGVKWDALGEAQPRVGEEIPISDVYIDAALDALESAGILFVHQVWAKLRPQDAAWRLSSTGGTAALNDAIYDAVSKGRWAVAEQLSSFGRTDTQQSPGGELTCRFNYYLAVKRQGRLAELEPDLSAEEVSHLHPRFQLAYYALTEKSAEFFALLPHVRSARLLRDHDLARWPIFDEMRADPRFPTPEQLDLLDRDYVDLLAAPVAPAPSEPADSSEGNTPPPS